ncbi:Protein kinase domain-containing protein, partial [Trichostrongylus colubriformis]
RGTLRYCSINCQEKGEQGRDDDLWCLLYMLAELRGPLPWATVKEGPVILEMKKKVELEELLKNCPIEFIAIGQHLMTLNYYLRPNYALLYRLLIQVMHAGNFRFSDPYDWEMKSSIPSSEECMNDFEAECTQTQSSTVVKKTAKEYNPFPAEFFDEDPFGF